MADAGASTAAVSSNPMDYARFVLYVRKGVPSCEKLLGLAARCQDVLIQDVDQIQGPRPPWLRGVPSLVALPSFELSTGTEAIAVLTRALSTGVQGMALGMVGSGLQVGSAGASLDDDFDDVGSRAPVLPRATDARYDEAVKEAPLASLEEMMRRRQPA